MKQFIKIHTIIRPSKAMATLAELGLYALISAMLAIPDFESSYGGFKEALKKHCCDGGSAFETAWRALKENGYVKMLRMPLDHNRFCYRYELRSVPDTKTPSILNMTAAAAREYLSRNRELVSIPLKNYTEVSWDMLMDSQLTLAAKGLFILIRREVDLAKNVKINVLKSNIMKKCREGKYAFNSAWKMLKETGYLLQRRVIDPKNGQINYEYELAGAATKTVREANKAAKNTLRKKTPAQTANAVTDDQRAKTTPHTINDRKVVAAIVRENIRYDDMLKYADQHNQNGVFYTAADLDGYVALITSTICSQQLTYHINGSSISAQDVRERLLSLTCNHILYVMHSMEGQKGVCNARNYQIAALYNSVETIGAYEAGYIA